MTMPLSEKDRLGLVNRFIVTVHPGDVDLGSWSKVDGLDVTFEVPEYRAGDGWNHRWFFPGHTQYTNVKLSRGANKSDTGKVQKWLSKTAKNYELGEVKVALRDAHHEEVHSWTLKNAIPVKWGITTFDAGGGSVAIETLELIHNGFLDDELNA
jgi:phage tail-like protein